MITLKRQGGERESEGPGDLPVREERTIAPKKLIKREEGQEEERRFTISSTNQFRQQVGRKYHMPKASRTR